MRIFVILIFIAAMLGGTFVIVRSKIATIQRATKASNELQQTFRGKLTKVPETSQYSYVLQMVDRQSFGINSMKVDFAPFEGKNVLITGQFSGSVLYVDSIIETK